MPTLIIWSLRSQKKPDFVNPIMKNYMEREKEEDLRR